MIDDATKYLLRQRIASMLDYPSVYMGGPSAGSVMKAIRIIENVMDEFEVTSKAERLAADVDMVRSWRKSAWDSLERE